MKVAFGTDEHTALTDAVRADLESRGHTVVAVDDGQWVEVGRAVGEAVASGRCDTGVLFCWTGTGASIAANKVRGRARRAVHRRRHRGRCPHVERRQRAGDGAAAHQPRGGRRRCSTPGSPPPVDPDEVDVIAGLEEPPRVGSAP